MSAKSNLYIKDDRYMNNKNRKPVHGGPWLALALVLVVATVVVAVYKYGPDLLGKEPPETTASTAAVETTTQTKDTEPSLEATPTPEIEETTTEPTQPPMPRLEMTAAKELTAAEMGIKSNIFDHNFTEINSYNRPRAIDLEDPFDYQKIPGVLTFRGNNFRDAPAYGEVNLSQKKMSQTWRKGIGSLPSSSWSFSWTGTGWTGQPLLVQWEDSVRQIMNIYPEKQEKQDLVEVIYATLDGNIYFLDLDDGQPTRDPIKIGAPIKGTPCVDPRGYPVLYVGQGDKNSNVKGIGFRVFNLIDQSLLHYEDCSKHPAHRTSWAACDSSPLFDGEADTLIFPNENGLVYTMQMNTDFNPAEGTLTIDPKRVTYRYKMPGLTLQGIESSMAVYGEFGYFGDNSGIFNCINLNTMEPVWSRQLKDDTDVTAVLKHEGDLLAVYTGTEVDWQKKVVGVYQGDAFVYKMDAMSGEVLWENSLPCYTKSAANKGDDINGGVMGSPLVGKHKIDDRVIFSFCMTQGVFSGNSVVAFDQDDGHMIWEYKMDRYSWSSPVAVYDEEGNGYIIIADSRSQLHLIDGQTGELLDMLELTNANEDNAGNIESSCAVFGNKLVIGTRGNIIAGVTLH